ncbi:hypothetical protein BV898_07327 [Hypsibius exemplaris]|uniref:Uncharacterized protein n=1 Tax=Hypsibius exemplaris TaxID=2072580 RepID=A0A1W0WU67_HYPEX|nr:hypothetical protein BV898_07327 [Hypsibius exemplaris]
MSGLTVSSTDRLTTGLTVGSTDRLTTGLTVGSTDRSTNGRIVSVLVSVVTTGVFITVVGETVGPDGCGVVLVSVPAEETLISRLDDRPFMVAAAVVSVEPFDRACATVVDGELVGDATAVSITA